MVNLIGLKLYTINGNVVSKIAWYIGWRIRWYGPEVTRRLLLSGSGVILKLPMRIVSIAQTPNPMPSNSITSRAGVDGKSGPVIAIIPKHVN